MSRVPPSLLPAPDGGARERAKPTHARARREKVVIDREGAQIALRLAIGRDGIGLELARKASLACIDVVELVVRLPHVRFPFDVTGGVAKFRHKRGALERLGLELDGERAARWAEPRLRGLLSVAPARVTVAPHRGGATVSIVARASAADAAGGVDVPALAFDVVLAPATEDLALVVQRPRGVNLPAPPIALALTAMGSLLGGAAKRRGATFVVPRLAAKLAAHLLPEAGARAPAAGEMVWVGAGETDGVLFVQLARGGAPADTSKEATLAAELATLVADADDHTVAGDHERARTLYLGALERAPRHAEIAARIAGIDRHVGGREEAAITILREAATTAHADATSAAILGDLLRASGDTSGAIAAMLRAADHEPSAAVAALVLARAASLTADPHDALGWLDRAVARAPRIAELRWQRAAARLAAGRLAEARADYQELEALAQGSDERYAVLRRAGEAHRERGLGLTAATIFERALLYRPDDPDTLAGLGAALAAEGRAARGAAILAHAIETRTKREAERGARSDPHPTAWMELELARVLGERLDDLPAAIARLRAVPDEAPEAIEARGWEGRYRARLGDHAGAALAFARLRERAQRDARAVPWLLEAAKHAESRGDLTVAQSHAGVALAIAPQDPDVLRAHRALGERIAAAAGMRPPPFVPPAPAPPRIVETPPTEPRVQLTEPPVQATAPAPPLGELLAQTAEDDSDLEARVEVLTQRLQGDPTNEAVVDELVDGLTKLGRGMELLALLSARLEDATPERREAFLPRHRAVLIRLEEEARAAGRDGEADLFKMAREAS